MTRFLLTAALAAAALTALPAIAGDKGPDEARPPPPVDVPGPPAKDPPAPPVATAKAPVALAAASHQGAALLQMFQTFCRDTHAGSVAVIAAAERAGYRAASADDLKAFSTMEIQGLQLRTKTVAGVRRLVGSGRGVNAPVEGRPAMDVCIVSISPGGGADAADAFGHWVGVEPVSQEEGSRSFFMFLEGPQGRQAISAAGTPGELRRRMRDGDLQLLMVGDDGDATLAIYGVMRPEI